MVGTSFFSSGDNTELWNLCFYYASTFQKTFFECTLRNSATKPAAFVTGVDFIFLLLHPFT